MPRKVWLGFAGPFASGLASLLLYSALIVLPLVGPLAGLFSPVPLLRELGSGRSAFLAWGWVLALFSGLTLVFGGPFLGLFSAGYLLVAVWPTMAAEWGQRRGWNSGRWLALLTLGSWLFATSLAVALAKGGNVGEFWARQAVNWVETNQNAAQFWTLGRPDLMTAAAYLGGYLLPFLVASYVMVLGVWLRARFAFFHLAPSPEPFSKYKSEEWLPFGFVAGGLGWVFAAGAWQWLAANLLATVVALYFVHGVAIIISYLGPKVGGNKWVRLAVVIFGLQLPVAFLFAALGLLDSFVTLRRFSAEGESSL